MGDSAEFYKNLIYKGKNFDSKQVVGEAKGTGALFFAAWARRNPNYFVLTVSPGGGKGTSLVQHDSVSWIVRKIMPVATTIIGWLGIMRSVPVAATRYIDAVTRSGAFIASAKNLTGPVLDDQNNTPGGKQYCDENKQEAMYEAMQTFL